MPLKFRAILGFSLFTITSNAQDFAKLSELFLKSDKSYHINFIKNTLNKTNNQELGIRLIQKFNSYNDLNKNSSKKLKELNDDFYETIENPNSSYACKKGTEYENKAKSIKKQIGPLRVTLSLAETNYKLCANNKFRTGNCNQQYNNYTNIYNRTTGLISKSNNYINLAKKYLGDCNKKVEKYNSEIDKLKRKIREVERSTSIQKQNLKREVNELWIQVANLLNKYPMPYKTYYENGTVKMSCFVKNGQLFGEAKYYYKDGQLEKKGAIKGKYNIGPWVSYYPNGNIHVKGTYNNEGQKNGVFEEYFENGTLDSKGSYVQDIKHGEFKYYFKESGKLKFDGYFNLGKMQGPWKVYRENGDFIKTEYYIDNKIVTKDMYQDIYNKNKDKNNHLSEEVSIKEIVIKINALKNKKYESKLDFENGLITIKSIKYNSSTSFNIKSVDFNQSTIEYNKSDLNYRLWIRSPIRNIGLPFTEKKVAEEFLSLLKRLEKKV